MIRPRVRRLPTAAVGLCLIAGAGCGPRDAVSESGDPVMLTRLVWGDERLLGPYAPLPAQRLIFLPLFDAEAPDSPFALSDWEMSKDGRTWTFRIRPDANWQDGVPVSAADVLFTQDLLANPVIAWRDAEGGRAEAIDDRTVVLHLNRPGLFNADVVYPKHLLETLDPATFQDWEFWTQPVGNGPYRYARFMAKTMVELTLDPDWSGPRLPVERYRFRFQGDPAVLFRSGEIDVAEVSSFEIEALAADPSIHVEYGGLSGHSMLWWNHNRPPLDDARVRRALTLALDRRELARLAGVPDTLPLTDVLVTPRQWRRGAFPPPLQHDSAEARRMLAGAGWVDTDGDGILDRDGRPLRLELIARADAEAAAVLAQAQLRRVGVAVDIQTMEYFSWENRLARGATDVVLGAMNPDLGTIGGGLLEPVRTGYHDPGLERLVVALDTAFSPASEDGIYAAAWEIFRRDAPVTLIRPLVGRRLVHERAWELWNRQRQVFSGS